MTHELNRGGARDNARLSLFGQPRPGREGVVFELVRSTPSEIPMPRMRRSRPPSSVSRFPSLDQLSTLWNVLKGDRASVRPSGCTWSPSRGTARAGDMRLGPGVGEQGALLREKDRPRRGVRGRPGPPPSIWRSSCVLFILCSGGRESAARARRL